MLSFQKRTLATHLYLRKTKSLYKNEEDLKPIDLLALELLQPELNSLKLELLELKLTETELLRLLDRLELEKLGPEER